MGSRGFCADGHPAAGGKEEIYDESAPADYPRYPCVYGISVASWWPEKGKAGKKGTIDCGRICHGFRCAG